jgi:FOG: EAL domain
MNLAFRFLKQIEQTGYKNIEIAFNVSAIQLLRDDFLPDLVQIIRETEINPSNLNIEITESIFSNNYQEINDKLEEIRKLGIKISIDDFGTGYSSLARERELNINCLKIDKYFIDKLNNHDVDGCITGDIISMAHKLGHSVIAEGVEYEEQKQYLIKNNCDFVQGYLFSKPLPEALAIDILTKTNAILNLFNRG